MGRHVVKSLRLVFFLLHDISSGGPFDWNRDQNQFFIMKLSENRCRAFWRSVAARWTRLLWFKGWKAKRSPSLFCLKLHSFVRRRTTRGSSGSGFSHIKWISSSLFSICKLHFPDGASAPGCSRGTAKKRNEELCTEKTVTMRDNH